MKRKLLEIKEDQIRKMFEKETGISPEEIEEISDCFPADIWISIKTINRTFIGKLTYEGRLRKGTLEEEK